MNLGVYFGTYKPFKWISKHEYILADFSTLCL